MPGKAVAIAALTALLVVVAGCHHDKYETNRPVKEECILPTNEARFNNPPTETYHKPPPKREDKSLMGGGAPPPGRMGGPGF